MSMKISTSCRIRTFFFLLSISSVVGDWLPTTAVPFINSEHGGINNPSFWLKNSHSTSCKYNTVRTFQITSRKGQPLSLIIRQNVKGTVIVRETSKKTATSHQVQFALNWTANNEKLLSAIQDNYRIHDKKYVLVNVYIGDFQSKTPMSPIVVGGTVTGFLVLMGAIVVGLYMSRRKTDAKNTARTATTSSEDEGGEDDDTDYYHPSSYMAGSQAPEDASLNLSAMHDLPTTGSHDMLTLTSEPKGNNTLKSNSKMRRDKTTSSKEIELADLPPPPPPPEAFERSTTKSNSYEVPTYEEISVSKSPAPLDHSSKATTPSNEETTPMYSVPNKIRGSPTFPPDIDSLQNEHSMEPAVSGSESDRSVASSRGGGGGGYLGSSMLGKTVMIVGLLSIAAQVTYSMCLEDISVKVLVFIPPDAKIESIHLYSSKDKPSVFRRTPWYLRNKEKFMTFDVDDASTQEKDEICLPQMVCPTAPNQTLLGCDSRTGKCVCQRGWSLDKRQICVDVDECEMGRCPPGMHCTNLRGSYSCTCLAGTFWNGVKCQVCSVGCPEGKYQSTECNVWKDRTCAPCSKCQKGKFTYKICSGRDDTQCVDVDEPYVRHSSDAKIVSNNVVFTTSANTFVEELHKPGDLTYPLSVSHNSQIMNFVWIRSSGIRVYVNVEDFHLIPEFNDIKHEDDNIFVQTVVPNQKSALNRVTYNYCRSPIPDYYILTMNKYKGRTTVLRDIVCNTTLKNCPAGFSDGQVYRFRTHSTQCPKTNVEVTELNDELNSVVCTDQTSLLSDVFNETLSKENLLRFPSWTCKQAIWKCRKCASDSKCGEAGFNESCCMVSCHAQKFCKEAASDECLDSPIECATGSGDSVQFVVQPMFEDLNRQFLCELRRKKAESIFTLNYRIIVPSLHGWNSTSRQVKLPTGGESKATQVSDYITVKYNNYLNVSNEEGMLLRGDYNNGRNEFDFTLFDFKPLSEFNKTKVKAVRYETSQYHDISTSEIQNERPFDINTINFHTKHGCHADTAKIHGKQLIYNRNTGQPVQAYTFKENRAFQYKLRAKDKTPTVDFFLPANESILYHYFSNSTLNYKSVKVNLIDRAEAMYMYSIEISGTMISCDSYLGITIHDKTTDAVVANYDLLVFCSDASSGLPTFQFKVKLPDTGPKNRLFRVTLRDSHTSVSYYVTTYSYSTSLMQNNTVNLLATGSQTTSPSTAFVAMLVCLGSIGFAFGLLYVLISYRLIIIARFRPVDNQCVYLETKRSLLISTYVIFKLLYSILFSFTVIVLLLQVICRPDLEVVQEFPKYHIELKQLVEQNIRTIREFKEKEMERQYSMREERLEACSAYAMKSVQKLKAYVDEHSRQLKDSKTYIEDKRFDLLMSEIQEYLETTKKHVTQHKKSVQSQVREILSDYNSLLVAMITNDWLKMPFINYNSLDNRSQPVVAGGALSGEAVDFLSYIGVDRPASALHQIRFINEQLDIMYNQMTFNVDRNLGLGILRGLDTSSISSVALKRFDTEMTVRTPEFVIESDVKVKSYGAGIVAWIVIISCDILLFTYRMCSLSHTLYRLKNGYTDEIEDNSLTSTDDAGNIEVEMSIIRRQIVSDGEMSRSLLDNAEKPDENLSFSENAGEHPRRAQSRAAESTNQSETELSKVHGQEFRSSGKLRARQGSRARSETSSAVQSDVETSRPMASDRVTSSLMKKRQTSRIQSENGESIQYSDLEHSRAKFSDAESVGKSVSIFSEPHRVYTKGSRNASRATSTAGSVKKINNIATVAPPSHDNQSDAASVDDEENISQVFKKHPGGCASTKLARVLLSKYAVPSILWIAVQALAIVALSLLADIVTYESLVQVANIDSMISHIGMYTSVVNSYLTTHAQMVSQTAQDTMVEEFNIHLHHIAKVKAIFENDVNWSLLDYHNKECVLNGMLTDHCTYQMQNLDVSIMPCQSFPIEAIQYTDNEGLDVKLISKNIEDVANSMVSLITAFVSLITFYVNAIAIIHILSLLINKILHHKGVMHILAVRYTRQRVPLLIEQQPKSKNTFQSSPSVFDSEPGSSHQMSEFERSLHHPESNRSSYTQKSVESREDEDPLLRNIKAQHSLSRQLTEETSEVSALLSTRADSKRSGSHNQSASETEL